MASWTLALDLDRTPGRSLVQQIAGALSADIQRGRLRPGDRLPGSRTLAGMLKVHRQTVVTAIDDLVAEGWLVCKKASGTFVADGMPDAPTNRRRDTERSRRASPSRFALELASAPLPELPRDAGAGALLMSGTRPDVRLLPAELIGRYYRRSIGAFGRQLLSYNHPAGVPRLRQQLALMLSLTRGLAIDPASIMVTRGSQMALTLLARALIRPGDAVAVEHPGYRPAWEAFGLAGAEVLPVHVDDRGLDVRALRQLIARRRIRAVYVTPHHQFPTTVTLSGPRRLELLDLAAHERFAVIEDDYDHEFHYSGKPVLPIASIDRAGVVAYVGTLSKVLAPGLRIGFVAAPSDLIEQLIAYRSFIDLQGDHVLECAIAQMLEDGLIQRHVRKMRRAYRARLGTLATALRQQLGDFLTFREPSGGTAIWVRTRSTRMMVQWARAARDRGVVFDAGGAFTLNGAPAPGARLGFACLTEDEMGRAVKALAAAASFVRSRSYPGAGLRGHA
jgi:GntR family transcriptional regulator / MocR family aminotransferase